MTKKEIIEMVPIQDLKDNDILVVRLNKHTSSPDVAEAVKAIVEWSKTHNLKILVAAVPHDFDLEKIDDETLKKFNLQRIPPE